MSRLRLAVYRSILGVIVLALSSAAIFFGLAAWDARRAVQEWDASAPSAASFVRRGDSFYSVHPAMIRQSFTAQKPADEFRVFVLGSSEAMGTPYVLQDFNALSGRLLGMPNEGGIATWLTAYLKRLQPGRTIKTVNAAKAARDMRETAATLKEVLSVGSPDMVVILDGNNERDSPAIDGYRLRRGADLSSAVDGLSRNFDLQLRTIARLAKDARVPVYVLTVPNNLRDWIPEGPDSEDAPAASRAATLPARVDPLHWFRAARGQEIDGRYADARLSYLKAKDLDYAFLRTRSRWNDSIRGLKGSNLRVVDMERIVFDYAAHGIPGADLFHDYCHMTLAGYRLVAFELALRIRADEGWPETPLALADADLRLFTSGQLRRLYLIKAFSWTRARFFTSAGGTARQNARLAAASYLDESRLIDDELALFVRSQKTAVLK